MQAAGPLWEAERCTLAGCTAEAPCSHEEEPGLGLEGSGRVALAGEGTLAPCRAVGPCQAGVAPSHQAVLVACVPSAPSAGVLGQNPPLESLGCVGKPWALGVVQATPDAQASTLQVADLEWELVHLAGVPKPWRWRKWP